MKMSKLTFITHIVEAYRYIEKTGESIIITEDGVPKIEIRKYYNPTYKALELLRGSVIQYDAATMPVDIESWENAWAEITVNKLAVIWPEYVHR